MCCPLAYEKHRIEEFRRHPNMVKAYLKAGKKFLNTHPDSKIANVYADEYEYFYRNLFCKAQTEWEYVSGGFFDKPDFKQFLENYFHVSL